MIKSIHARNIILTVLCNWPLVYGGMSNILLGSWTANTSAENMQQLLEQKKQEYRTVVLNLLRNYKTVDELNKPLQLGDESALPVVLIASRYYYNDLLQLLLAKGAIASSQALMKAICGSNLDGLKILLSSGVDPNVPDDDGRTPLMLTVQMQDIFGMRLLLHNETKPADVTIQDKNGDDALILLARQARIKYDVLTLSMIKELMHHGANPCMRSKQTEQTAFQILESNPITVATAQELKAERALRVNLLTKFLSKGYEEKFAPLPYDVAYKVAVIRYGYYELAV